MLAINTGTLSGCRSSCDISIGLRGNSIDLSTEKKPAELDVGNPDPNSVYGFITSHAATRCGSSHYQPHY